MTEAEEATVTQSVAASVVFEADSNLNATAPEAIKLKLLQPVAKVAQQVAESTQQVGGWVGGWVGAAEVSSAGCINQGCTTPHATPHMHVPGVSRPPKRSASRV